MKLLKMLVGALITAGILIGATNVALAGSTRQSLSSESALEAIKKRGTLRIGLTTFVPWAMRDKKGDLIGFEIDVGKRVAEDMVLKSNTYPPPGMESYPHCLLVNSTSSSVVCQSQ